MQLGLIWAQTIDGVIGKDNKIPWHIPEDFLHFKQQTINQTVIMGRKTWDSLPGRFKPLPQRLNVVVSRNINLAIDGVPVVSSLFAAIELSKKLSPCSKIWVIGGAQLYQQALPLADFISMTQINISLVGDVLAPKLSPKEWDCTTEQSQQIWQQSKSGVDYRILHWHRKDAAEPRV